MTQGAQQPESTPTALIVTDHEATADELQLFMLRYDLKAEVCSLEVLALERLAVSPAPNILLVDCAMEQSHQLVRLASMNPGLRIVALVRGGLAPEWEGAAVLKLPFGDAEMDEALGSYARVIPTTGFGSEQDGATTRPTGPPASLSSTTVKDTDGNEFPEEPVRQRPQRASSPRRTDPGGSRASSARRRDMNTTGMGGRKRAKTGRDGNRSSLGAARRDGNRSGFGPAQRDGNRSSLGASRRSGSGPVRGTSSASRRDGNRSSLGASRRDGNRSSLGASRREGNRSGLGSAQRDGNRSSLGASRRPGSGPVRGTNSSSPRNRRRTNASGLRRPAQESSAYTRARRDLSEGGPVGRPASHAISPREWSSDAAVRARRVRERGPERHATSFDTPLPPAGTFHGMPLSSVLFKLFMQRRTGVLLIVDNGVERDFGFKDGEPVGLGGALSSDALGESLVRLGYVSLGELMELMRSAGNLEHELVRDGLVTEGQIKEARALLVFDQLVECFTWRDARYAFNEGGDVWQTIEPINPLQVIYEGLNHSPGSESMREQLEERAHDVVHRTPRLDTYIYYLPDEPWISSVLDACDGNATLVEVVEMFPRHEDECLGLIYLLLEGRMLQLNSTQHPPSSFPRYNTPMPQNGGLAEVTPSRGVLGPTGPDGTFQPGDMLSRRYRIEEVIGEGSTSLVYQARDQELDEEIALKVFTIGEISPEYLPRFKQELSIARSLAHPNVIRVYDISTFDGLKYISMERLRGDVLHHLMDEPMDVAVVLDYLTQACRGLHAAHKQDVIHRDVKPENFFITNEGVLKVMDFGIAKRTSSRMTLIGFAAGTPAYMSPEQIETFTSVTAASDIYALGVVAYEMLTGELPFWDEDLETLLKMHLRKKPRPPIELRPDLPAKLNAIILAMLAKKSDARPSSCEDLALDFEALHHELAAG